MPKKDKSARAKRIAVGIPEAVYLEIEKYAASQKPQLFLYEVLVQAWNDFKKNNRISTYV